MSKLNKILFIILLPSLAWSQRTHTFIDSVMMETQNQLKCELAVALSKDKKEVRIMRLDEPKGKMTLTHFSNNPSLVAKYGIAHQVQDLVETRGYEIKTVQASFNFDDNNRDLILLVHLANKERIEKRISINQDFFKDHAKSCLK